MERLPCFNICFSIKKNIKHIKVYVRHTSLVTQKYVPSPDNINFKSGYKFDNSMAWQFIVELKFVTNRKSFLKMRSTTINVIISNFLVLSVYFLGQNG